MTRYNEQEKNLKTATPLIFLYDASGNQTFTSAGAFHVWDTIEIKTSDFTYTADTNRIYCGNTINGIYKITFNCSFLDSDEESSVVVSQIFKNGTAVTGSSVADGGVSYNQAGYYSQSITYFLYLTKGDYIQLYTYAPGSSYTIYSLSDTSRIAIEFIPMQGWNNSAGGQTNYKGGVMR